MLMTSTIIAPLIMYSYMLGSFLINNTHFLMSLLCLEGMILSLVILLPMNMTSSMTHLPAVTLVMLTLGACEASLGLSLLVKISRTYGTDMLSNMSKNKC